MGFRHTFALVGILSSLVGCGSSDEPTLEVGSSAQGQTLQAHSGQAIDLKLQTIGPGHYGDPQLSSGAVRFDGMDYSKNAVPAGPTQFFHFHAVESGHSTIVIPRVDSMGEPFTVTFDVTP